MRIVEDKFKISRLKIGVWILFFVLVSIPLFMQLHAFSLRLWDESRMAANALEMFRNREWWVLYFEGKPDLWNTKPPVVTWIHLGMFSLMGIQDWVLRIPGALAGLSVVLLALFFTTRYFRRPDWGMFAGLILVTSQGFVRLHGTRTCEYDAILSVFTTAYVLVFWLLLAEHRLRYWLCFTAALVLAGLTKGIAGYLFLPALFMASLVFGHRFYSRANFRYILMCVCLTALFVLGYYLYRESLHPGFLRSVYDNELGGRYLGTLEGHEHPFGYYLDNMLNRFYGFWFPLWLAATAAGFFYTDKRERHLHAYLTLNTLFYLLVISLGRSKLEWYDLPLYPLMALVIGLFLKNLMTVLYRPGTQHALFRVSWILPLCVTLSLFVYPYRDMIQQINRDSRHDMESYETCLPYYLRSLAKPGQQPDIREARVIDYGYVPHVHFYVEWLNLKGRTFTMSSREDIRPGDIVITRMGDTKSYIDEHFNYKLIDEQAWVRVCQIQSRKP